jgi:lipid A 3-O-deacylase
MSWLKKGGTLGSVGLVALGLLTGRLQAQEATNYMVGVRGGATFWQDPGNFQQADIFAAKYLSWTWGDEDGWNLKPRWEVSAGWLHNEAQQGFDITTGPVLELRHGDFPVTLEGGISPSALTRSEFPDRNLGGWFEFTDHLGVNWHINDQFTIGWRYQHMSNGGIYKHNPGVNLQMLSASYSF